MIRLVHALFVVLFALATSAGGAAAHHAVHCVAPVSEEAIAAHDHGGHFSFESEEADLSLVPANADPASAECPQHLCSAYSFSAAEPARERVVIPVADRPSDNSISGLSRPESPYRPPNA